jgi:hypothetical protein
MARPDLAVAHPSGAIAGTFWPINRQAVDVLMDDGTWGYAEATGWAKDVSGAWRIRLLRYGLDAEGMHSQFEDWWMYDPERVRLVREDEAGVSVRVGQRLPDWWCWPAQWAHGHEWGLAG